MELTDADELNLATTSDSYLQNALDDTASFANVPDVDDNELAEFLAIVVDRTGQPVEVRSNNDQFSCDIRNLKMNIDQLVNSFNSHLEKHSNLVLPSQPNSLNPLKIERGNPLPKRMLVSCKKNLVLPIDRGNPIERKRNAS